MIKKTILCILTFVVFFICTIFGMTALTNIESELWAYRELWTYQPITNERMMSGYIYTKGDIFFVVGELAAFPLAEWDDTGFYLRGFVTVSMTSSICDTRIIALHFFRAGISLEYGIVCNKWYIEICTAERIRENARVISVDKQKKVLEFGC